MPLGVVAALGDHLIAVPPPVRPYESEPFNAMFQGDLPPAAPSESSSMSDEDIALVGIALGLGILVLIVGIVAALFTIRHHFLRLERQRGETAEIEKASHAVLHRRKVRTPSSWTRTSAAGRPPPLSHARNQRCLDPRFGKRGGQVAAENHNPTRQQRRPYCAKSAG